MNQKIIPKLILGILIILLIIIIVLTVANKKKNNNTEDIKPTFNSTQTYINTATSLKNPSPTNVYSNPILNTNKPTTAKSSLIATTIQSNTNTTKLITKLPTLLHTESSAQFTTNTQKSTSVNTNYSYAQQAEKEGYINLRTASSKNITHTAKCYFEVKHDSPNQIISAKTLNSPYTNNINNFAVTTYNNTKIFIPIPANEPFITNYYFVKGILVHCEYNTENCFILMADSNYIYKEGSSNDLKLSSKDFEW